MPVPSRMRCLIVYVVGWLPCNGVVACGLEPAQQVLSSPPPIVGHGTHTSNTQQSTPATSAATLPGTGGATATAGRGATTTPNTTADDADAGTTITSANAAGSSAAAGAGGGAPLGSAAGSSGHAGAGGTEGAAGTSPANPSSTSDACSGQFCFSVLDCWTLSAPGCNYTACNNFTCM